MTKKNDKNDKNDKKNHQVKRGNLRHLPCRVEPSRTPNREYRAKKRKKKGASSQGKVDIVVYSLYVCMRGSLS